MKRDLSAFWETVGRKTKNKANDVLHALNAASGVPRNLLRELRKWLEESNQAFEHAGRLDSTISVRTTEARKHNEKLLEQVREIERKL